MVYSLGSSVCVVLGLCSVLQSALSAWLSWVGPPLQWAGWKYLGKAQSRRVWEQRVFLQDWEGTSMTLSSQPHLHLSQLPGLGTSQASFGA